MWQQADAAHAQGKQVVVMQHHNAVEHFDGQAIFSAPYVVKDYQKVAEAMIQHGIHLVITGHQHMQDIAQYRTWENERADSLIDITTASTVAYPNAWRMMKVNRDFTDTYVLMIKGIATEYLRPYFSSMFTDANQYGLEMRSSRTNDIDVVLTLPGATNNTNGQ